MQIQREILEHKGDVDTQYFGVSLEIETNQENVEMFLLWSTDLYVGIKT